MSDPLAERDQLKQALELAAREAWAYEGKVAFRPAIVNWSTQVTDVDALVDVLLELLAAPQARSRS